LTTRRAAETLAVDNQSDRGALSVVELTVAIAIKRPVDSTQLQ